MTEMQGADAAMAVSGSADPRPHCQNLDACAARSTRHCRACQLRVLNGRADRKAKASASMKRYLAANPEKAAQHTAGLLARRAKLLAEDPAFRERLREQGRAHAANNQDAWHTPEARKKAGRALSERYLGHIPPSLRDAYRETKGTKLSPEERLALVIDQAEADQRRAKAQIERAALEQRAKHERDLASRY